MACSHIICSSRTLHPTLLAVADPSEHGERTDPALDSSEVEHAPVPAPAADETRVLEEEEACSTDETPSHLGVGKQMASIPSSSSRDLIPSSSSRDRELRRHEPQPEAILSNFQACAPRLSCVSSVSVCEASSPPLLPPFPLICNGVAAGGVAS